MNNNNALSYHLAFALIQLIKNADAEIYHRLNLTVLIQGCVTAMGTKSDDLEEIKDKIHYLREHYEPIMDLNDLTTVKRIAFEIELDHCHEALLKVINDNNLVSQSVMQEIIASKWDNASKKKLGSKIQP